MVAHSSMKPRAFRHVLFIHHDFLSLFRFMGLHNMREQGRGIGREAFCSAREGNSGSANTLQQQKAAREGYGFVFFSSSQL